MKLAKTSRSDYMLETKKLCKIYKPKKGVPVQALKNVSLKFSDKGMVFLLGKSGSGKSTLLNVLGGLDNYNSGEIIIKGVSSKEFRQKHFDSYRNTYVGFIFQEYNILDDFTVGANIALSIQLQGRKPTNDEINNILKEVDLAGYGQRKPNELSGGQKQRVAIARALVKNPQIIMADEPTGALDSNTGTQVLTTLKKLSKDRLVIVVSHDREFAMKYADRIIELADGEVISDTERSSEYKEQTSSLVFEADTIKVPANYHLTEDDLKAINEYITAQKSGISLKINKDFKQGFKDTDQASIKVFDTTPFKLIKSKLPLKNAFKIGASSLKCKKFRLVLTILLSCIAFGLFGLVDTFSAYNHINACTTSIIDSNITYASVKKTKKFGEGINQYYQDYGYKINPDDLELISENVGTKLRGVYYPFNYNLGFDHYFDESTQFTKTDYNIYATSFSGFVEIDNDYLTDSDCTLVAGSLPDGNSNQIAISAHVAESFIMGKYRDLNSADNSFIKISSYSDLIGKTINLLDRDYIISGVVNTNFDFDRYKVLMDKKDNKTTADELIEYALYNEYSYASRYSLAGMAMVGNGHIERLAKEIPNFTNLSNKSLRITGEGVSEHINEIGLLDGFKADEIIWLDGKKDTLGEKEIIISTDLFYYYEENNKYKNTKEINDDIALNATAILGTNNYELTLYDYFSDRDDNRTVFEGYKIVGVIDSQKHNIYSAAILNDSFATELIGEQYGLYQMAIGAMPDGRENIKKAVSYCFNETEDIRYELKNSVTYELEAVHEILRVLSDVFLYIGIGFAVFAALMLANFINISISYKKQEIGILRAIGSRGNDVFRIFFAESFIIAMINFVLSATGVGIATAVINHFIRQQGILITVLSFNIRQIALLLVISIAIAFIASYLPVKKIASKRPIDAIRDR